MLDDMKYKIPFVNSVNLQSSEKRKIQAIRYEENSDGPIISVPHGGLWLPDKFASFYKITPDCLREIEPYTDRLYKFKGFQIISKFPPFVVDLNRRIGRDSRVPAHLQNDPLHYVSVKDKLLLAKPLTEEAKKELLTYYDIYHSMLRTAISRMKEKHGFALLIDGHSMESKGARAVIDKGRTRSDFVVGTLHDSSAHPGIINSFCTALGSVSHKVTRNIPYAGGYITRLYNDPANDIHVIQLETRMSLFMHEWNEEKPFTLKKGFKNIHRLISTAIRSAWEKAEELY